MGPEPGRLGVGGFAFPWPLRDQLVAADLGSLLQRAREAGNLP